MVVVKLEGGLGNQMFQYAFGKQVSYKYSISLKLDISDLNGYRNYELDIFKLDIAYANSEDLFLFDRRNLSLLGKILFKIKTGFLKATYFLENEVEELFTFPVRTSKNIFIKGHWQNEQYFKNIESLIRTEFLFPEMKDNVNKELCKLIEQTNSVGIHVRRGDYLLEKNNKVHGILPMEYYIEGIRYISERIKDTVLFIFSDDPVWVKKNLVVEGEVYYVSGNKNKHSYIDMQLMSYCKHNIIANSSFSWWSAWLNTNLTKIVVAPVNWFSNPSKNSFHRNIVPKEWIRL